jgi:hypothetical protein
MNMTGVLPNNGIAIKKLAEKRIKDKFRKLVIQSLNQASESEPEDGLFSTSKTVCASISDSCIIQK